MNKFASFFEKTFAYMIIVCYNIRKQTKGNITKRNVQ